MRDALPPSLPPSVHGRRPFPGFPSGRVTVTPLPNAVFAQIVPEIDGLVELKVFLHVYWRIANSKGYPRFVTGSQLAADALLRRSLRAAGVDPVAALGEGLSASVARGTLLHLPLKTDNGPEDLYFVHTAQSRRAIDQIRRGDLDVGQIAVPEHLPPMIDPEDRPTIFDLYEQNIGLLTPMIAEELADAERLYPADWISDAFREAVGYNKRNWRYVKRILERWAIEGRRDETPR